MEMIESMCRRDFCTAFVTAAHEMNDIVNEIETEKGRRRKNFLTSFVSHKQNVNRIVSEIEIDQIFDFLCYRHKQNINGKVSEIEIGKRKPAAGENFFDFIC